VEGPDWIREAARKYTLRITDWASQTWMLIHSPQRFMNEWLVGTREALNPLRFLAVGTTVNLLADRGGRWLMHLPRLPHDGWFGWLSGSPGQMLNSVILGGLMHFFLRRWSKAPFRNTLAAAVFGLAGPGTACEVLGWLISGTIQAAHKQVPLLDKGGAMMPFPTLAAGIVGTAWMFLTIAAVHRMRWWAPLLAYLAASATFAVGGGTLWFVAALVARKLGY
jgi:hypothetical protein